MDLDQLLGIFNLLMLTTNQPTIPPVHLKKLSQRCDLGTRIGSPGEGILMVPLGWGLWSSKQSRIDHVLF